ncbi:MAG: LysM peptidoglycan-binding domain-containing protein [Bacteroidota bacterium]
MRTIFLIGILLLGISGTHRLVGQSSRSTQTLSYQAFKQQCVNFRTLNNSQIWIVYFWASWNSTSLYDFEQLKRMASLYSAYPIRFIGISEDKNAARWEQMFQEFQLPGDQVLLSESAQINDIKRAFQYKRLPGYFVVANLGDIYQVTSLEGLNKLLSQKLHELSPVGGPPTIPVVNPAPNPGVPVVQPQPSPQKKQGWVTHTVKPGETLYRLFVSYGVPVDQIKKINKLKNNNIIVGQVLKIRKIE